MFCFVSKFKGIKLSQKRRKQKSNFKQSQGDLGGLGILQNSQKVNIEDISTHTNWMGSIAISTKSNIQTIVINFYGPTPSSEKLVVWNEISSFINTKPNEAIIIGEDFNVILKKEEKYGGISTVTRAMEDFREWIGKNTLIDIPTKNGLYTWNNRSIGFYYIVER